jgi:hypothetical protein
MFANEVLVLIEAPTGRELTSLLVDADLVRTKGELSAEKAVEGELKVQAKKLGERAHVMLPVTSPEFGRVMAVPSDLVSA